MYKLIETNNGQQIVFDVTLIEPNNLKALNSHLAFKIVSELAKEPCCVMDLSKKLKEHEQKIYYHIRKLKNAGIIKRIRKERRLGLKADIYKVTSPVIAIKLYNNGLNFNTEQDDGIFEF